MRAYRYYAMSLLLVACLTGTGFGQDSRGAEPLPACSPGAACADVPEKTFDFGKVNAHREHEHIFPVMNFGAQVLEIKNVIVG